MSPFSLLVLLMLILSLCPVISLANVLSILLTFSKVQLLVCLILCYSSFVSTCLISALSVIISCLQLLLGEFPSCYSRGFRCSVNLLLYLLDSKCDSTPLSSTEGEYPKELDYVTLLYCPSLGRVP